MDAMDDDSHATGSSIDATDREKLKEDYIKSLGLSKRPPKPQQVPCLRKRVDKFERLMSKSAPFDASKILPSKPDIVGRLKNTRKSGQTISPGSRIEKPNSNVSSSNIPPVFPRETRKPFTEASGPHKSHSEPNSKRETPQSDRSSSPEILHSEEKLNIDALLASGEPCIPHSSVAPRRRWSAPKSGLHTLEFELLSSPPSSSSSHTSLGSTTSSVTTHDADSDIKEKRARLERARSLGTRREMFEYGHVSLSSSSSSISSQHWDSQRQKIKDFKVDPTVIHKVYTEEEKSFILDSFRKSGGIQQRTKSLVSKVDIKKVENLAMGVTSKPPKPRRVPGKLAQSMPKVFRHFENIEQSQSKGNVRRASCEKKIAGDQRTMKKNDVNTKKEYVARCTRDQEVTLESGKVDVHRDFMQHVEPMCEGEKKTRGVEEWCENGPENKVKNEDENIITKSSFYDVRGESLQIHSCNIRGVSDNFQLAGHRSESSKILESSLETVKSADFQSKENVTMDTYPDYCCDNEFGVVSNTTCITEISREDSFECVSVEKGNGEVLVPKDSNDNLVSKTNADTSVRRQSDSISQGLDGHSGVDTDKGHSLHEHEDNKSSCPGNNFIVDTENCSFPVSQAGQAGQRADLMKEMDINTSGTTFMDPVNILGQPTDTDASNNISESKMAEIEHDACPSFPDHEIDQPLLFLPDYLNPAADTDFLNVTPSSSAPYSLVSEANQDVSDKEERPETEEKHVLVSGEDMQSSEDLLSNLLTRQNEDRSSESQNRLQHDEVNKSPIYTCLQGADVLRVPAGTNVEEMSSSNERNWWPRGGSESVNVNIDVSGVEDSPHTRPPESERVPNKIVDQRANLRDEDIGIFADYGTKKEMKVLEEENEVLEEEKEVLEKEKGILKEEKEVLDDEMVLEEKNEVLEEEKEVLEYENILAEEKEILEDEKVLEEEKGVSEEDKNSFEKEREVLEEGKEVLEKEQEILEEEKQVLEEVIEDFKKGVLEEENKVLGREQTVVDIVEELENNRSEETRTSSSIQCEINRRCDAGNSAVAKDEDFEAAMHLQNETSHNAGMDVMHGPTSKFGKHSDELSLESSQNILHLTSEQDENGTRNFECISDPSTLVNINVSEDLTSGKLIQKHSENETTSGVEEGLYKKLEKEETPSCDLTFEQNDLIMEDLPATCIDRYENFLPIDTAECMTVSRNPSMSACRPRAFTQTTVPICHQPEQHAESAFNTEDDGDATEFDKDGQVCQSSSVFKSEDDDVTEFDKEDQICQSSVKVVDISYLDDPNLPDVVAQMNRSIEDEVDEGITDNTFKKTIVGQKVLADSPSRKVDVLKDTTTGAVPFGSDVSSVDVIGSDVILAQEDLIIDDSGPCREAKKSVDDRRTEGEETKDVIDGSYGIHAMKTEEEMNSVTEIYRDMAVSEAEEKAPDSSALNVIDLSGQMESIEGGAKLKSLALESFILKSAQEALTPETNSENVSELVTHSSPTVANGNASAELFNTSAGNDENSTCAKAVNQDLAPSQPGIVDNRFVSTLGKGDNEEEFLVSVDMQVTLGANEKESFSSADERIKQEEPVTSNVAQDVNLSNEATQKEVVSEVSTLISDATVIDNLPQPGSSKFSVRASYSDISGSVESFYSGVSESPDSFFSADDEGLQERKKESSRGTVNPDEAPVRKDDLMATDDIVLPGETDKAVKNKSGLDFDSYLREGNTELDSIAEELDVEDLTPVFSQEWNLQGSVTETQSETARILSVSFEDDNESLESYYEECLGESEAFSCLMQPDMVVGSSGIVTRGEPWMVDVEEDDVFEDCMDVSQDWSFVSLPSDPDDDVFLENEFSSSVDPPLFTRRGFENSDVDIIVTKEIEEEKMRGQDTCTDLVVIRDENITESSQRSCDRKEECLQFADAAVLEKKKKKDQTEEDQKFGGQDMYEIDELDNTQSTSVKRGHGESFEPTPVGIKVFDMDEDNEDHMKESVAKSVKNANIRSLDENGNKRQQESLSRSDVATTMPSLRKEELEDNVKASIMRTETEHGSSKHRDNHGNISINITDENGHEMLPYSPESLDAILKSLRGSKGVGGGGECSVISESAQDSSGSGDNDSCESMDKDSLDGDSDDTDGIRRVHWMDIMADTSRGRQKTTTSTTSTTITTTNTNNSSATTSRTTHTTAPPSQPPASPGYPDYLDSQNESPPLCSLAFISRDDSGAGVKDMAGVEDASGEVQELAESPGSGLHRTPSAGTFQQGQTDGGRQKDPYRMLERSQSDASLLKRQDLEMLATDDDVHLTAAESSSVQNISECNRVYLDLSRAEAFERVELGESSGAMMRTSSGRLLETIPQDEELKTGDLSYVYASHRSFSQESSSSVEDLTFSGKGKSKDGGKFKSPSGAKGSQDNNSITSSKSNLRSSFQIYSHSLKQKVRQLQMGSLPEQMNALSELNVLMEQAWSMPIYGKDLAYELCDILRTESALDIIVSNLASSNRELMRVSARLLEQSLTTSNRRQVAENGLELVVKMIHDARGDCELAQTCTGILESLFKTSEETCAKVIKLGGLDVITYWCRCNDRVTLKNCAIALSNLALYGGGENQQEMAKHKVPEWLFPLAFVEDDSVRYYALLAIGVMVSNKEIENAVMSSGTLALVLPFIDSHDPAEFAQRDMSHRHGRSPGWLKRLIPVLSSKREEAQALAAFHFVMEAGIKSEQGRKEILYKIGAVDPLKWLASTPNRVASKLAAQALKIIGEEIPHKLSQQVPLWTCDDVVHWIAQVGFGGFAHQFQDCLVDGDLLLRLTEEELRDSLCMSCAITRKRFLRELRDLKISSDYTSCDPSMLGAWLREVGEDMSQYTYQMLHTGVDRPLLRSINDNHLTQDCKIGNGIHRMKILTKIDELRSVINSPTCARYDSIDGMSASASSHKPPIDVFISYRRSNGSQLASLLKVHLQLRGFTVFIDIEKLRAGKFDESLLESVKQAKNFIIVLTPNSLDRCMGDDEKKDWVHREITAAIDAGSNIIPLLDNFKWPAPDSLPEDMRNVLYFNAVRWIHDYQDACVDKLEQFLRGEANPQQRHPGGTVGSTISNNGASGTSTPKQSGSGFESPNSPPYQRAQGMRKTSSVESPVDS